MDLSSYIAHRLVGVGDVVMKTATKKRCRSVHQGNRCTKWDGHKGNHMALAPTGYDPEFAVDSKGNASRTPIQLQRGGRAAKIAGSMARPTKESDETRYRGRLGRAVRLRRESLKMSVERLVESLAAQGIEVNQQTIYSYESGHRPIHVDHLPAFAAALKTTIRKLMPEA